MRKDKNLKKIDSNINQIGYDFENFKKIQKHYKDLRTKWKGDALLGPLEGNTLIIYVKHPRIKDLVSFDEAKIIDFIAEKANVYIAKIRPVIYIDHHLAD